MANEIKMPQLSDTMSSGKILEWKKSAGDAVKRGDILAEVETDKANLEIECFQDGTLLKIVIPAGQDAKVGEVIAVIGQAGEGVAPTAASTAHLSTPVTAVQTSTTAPVTQPIVAAPVMATSNNESSRIKVSPLARKIAQDKNIDLAVIQGSGPAGRIIRRDLEATADQTAQPIAAPSVPQASPPSSAAQSAPSGGKLVPFSKMRETIARRMVESVTQAPHFYVTASIDMGEALKLREVLKAKEEYKGISVNHLVIKAVGYGLAHEPRVNFAVKDGQIYEPAGINVGIITSVNDGLLIPVIRDVPNLSLRDVVFEARAAVERARAGRPNASDLSGGTFSISNMGMFDVENFTAIINPGQGSILAVSSVQQVALVKNGQLTVGSQMKVTVSVDHRIIDGVMASTFLKYFKEALEIPALLMA